MEGKNTNKGVIALLIIFIIITLILGAYIVHEKLLNTNNKDEIIIEETNNNTKTIASKLDDSKDWVYDAEYEKNVTSESYTHINNNTYYSKDIIVPFINIDSNYANNSNTEIKDVFDSAIAVYNEGASGKLSYVDECSYQKYITNEILSIIMTYGVGATDVVSPEYYTYNIDLTTGNELSYEEAYKLAGYNYDNINSKVESAITNTMKEKYTSGTDFDTYNTESINNYKTSVSNNTIKYFLSNNGKLNIIVKLIIPAGRGEFDTIIEID